MQDKKLWDCLTHIRFHYRKDFYGKVEQVYAVEWINPIMGRNFENGEDIVYVNGEFPGESEIGKLMHGLRCTKSDVANYGLLADRIQYLKENPKEVQEMCKAMENMRNEAVEENMLQTSRNLMKILKFSVKKAMKIPEINQWG